VGIKTGFIEAWTLYASFRFKLNQELDDNNCVVSLVERNIKMPKVLALGVDVRF